MEFLLLVLLVICIIQLHGLSQRMAKLEKQNIRPEKNAPEETRFSPVQRETKPIEVRQKTKKSTFFLRRKRALLERKTCAAAVKIWRWICFGDEKNATGVSREYAVATTWLIRLGIMVLLFGIGFFLKYSIDRNWTSPVVRIIMTGVAGMVMAVAGTWKRNCKYRPLAIAVSGAGFVMLYLCIGVACKMYHFISPQPAFALMIAVTAAAMLSSLFSDALLTAILGCAGGYLTPVFVNTGSKNLPALFLYMAILGTGTLLIAFRRKWILLNIVCFIFYTLIGTGALACGTPVKDTALLLIGLSLLNYLIFDIQLIASSRKRDMTLFDILLMAGNSLVFPGIAFPLAFRYFHDIPMPSMLMGIIALTALIESVVLYLRNQKCPVILAVFLQIKFCFALVMTAELLLGKNWITAAWSVMALLFAGAAIKLKSRTLILLSLLLFLFTGFRELSFEWITNSYLSGLLQRLQGTGFFIVCLWLSAWVLNKAAKKMSAEEKSYLLFNQLPQLLYSISGTLVFLYSSFEVHTFWNHNLHAFCNGGLSVYWSMFAFGLLLWGINKQIKVLRICAFSIFILTVLKIFFVDLASLEQLWRIVAFAVIGAVMLSGAVFYMKFKNLFSEKQSPK